jgi:hypothetical protein
MGEPFAHIARCLDLKENDVADAIRDRRGTKALLAHLAAISTPNTGSAKALLVLSRMATTACNWIDGDLSIDVRAGPDGAVIEAGTELGGGLRERLFPPLSFRAPIEEFVRAIDRVPRMVKPLVIRTRSADRISLSAIEALRRTTAPPPPIEISTESLFAQVGAPAIPREADEAQLPVQSPMDEIDAGWDD